MKILSAGLQQLIAAVAAAPAGDVARRLQRQQDLLEELARQLLLLAQLPDLQAFAGLGPGKGHHRLEGIAGALGNHGHRDSRRTGAFASAGLAPAVARVLRTVANLHPSPFRLRGWPMPRQIPEYLTFDDVLMKPGASSVLPAQVKTATRLTRSLQAVDPDHFRRHGHGDGGAARHRHGAGRGPRHHPQEPRARTSRPSMCAR